MPINNNVKLIDLPFFELLNQLPAATSATAGITTVEDGNDRYIYAVTGANFYRYDVNADTWHTLATVPLTPAVSISLKYTRRRGYHGRVLSATSTSVTIPGIKGNRLDKQKIQILYGTGAGQERTLSYVGETVYDSGVISAVITGSAGITDSTKKWRVNQWAGYTLALTFGTGLATYKKILYNTTTDLYIVDVNLMPHDPWNNQAYVTAAPYTIPVATAGSQAHYEILSHNFTVDSAWDVTPDTTSFFTTLSGGIYMITGTASAPFFSLLYYDILNDMWQTKTAYQNLLSAAATDFSLERTGKLGTYFVANTGSSAVTATSRTFQDTSLNLTPDRYSNHRLLITEGTGRGQDRRIVSHSNNNFTVARNWDITPDNTSKYQIWADYDKLYFAPGGYAGMFSYSPDNDYWMQGLSFDDGVTASISVVRAGWTPLGVSTGARIAAGVTAVNPIPTAGGSGYLVGDVLTCSVGGTGAQVRVTSIATTGAVTGIELIHSGTVTGFTTGTGKATTSGTGTGCTIEITSVGATALITTATSHWFVTGDAVTFYGCTEAAWNTQHTIIGVPTITTFCVAVTATANMQANTGQLTTAIIDPVKNWNPNEHAGKIVHLSVAGTAPTSQLRWIIGNSPSQLNVATITAAVNGTSKYVIYDSKLFGVDNFRKESNKRGYGFANTGTTTTLVDNTKNWNPNQYANTWMTIIAGTGFANGRILIANNTPNTLNFLSVQSFSPDSTTRYEINETWGNTAAGSTTTIPEQSNRNWPTNYWPGKRVRVIAGTGVGQEASVTSSTGNTLTTATITAPDATSAYAILGIPARSTGTGLLWNWGYFDNDLRGRYIYSPRGGGSNMIDVYDLASGKWSYGGFILPQNEGFTTGSSYAYDGANTIFMSRSATTAPVRIFKFNIANNTFTGGMTTTWLQGTATIGNFMEIAETEDANVKFIYVVQNTGTLISRAMIVES